MYKYIWGIIDHKKGTLYRINGIADHIHILSDLHPTIALADYIKDIKVSSSLWMKKSSDFPNFKGWEEGYSAFTYSFKDKTTLINYIKNQQEHHKKESSKDELIRILKEYGIDFDERYLS
ncbi:transposase [Bacteroidia bacterium]|nr:transposase [Bacteroidia bacterium]